MKKYDARFTIRFNPNDHRHKTAMSATSKEKREQIILEKKHGEKTKNIILWLNVRKSTIDKVWWRYRETGSGAAKPYKGQSQK